MNNQPRFIKEYANHLFNSNKIFLSPDKIVIYENLLHRAQDAQKRGLITIDETITLLQNAFNTVLED